MFQINSLLKNKAHEKFAHRIQDLGPMQRNVELGKPEEKSFMKVGGTSNLSTCSLNLYKLNALDILMVLFCMTVKTSHKIQIQNLALSTYRPVCIWDSTSGYTYFLSTPTIPSPVYWLIQNFDGLCG